MPKQPASDHISGSVIKSEIKVNNGKLKIKRVKAKSELTKNLSDEAAKVANDVVNPVKRDVVNKEVRNDINPAKGAHSPVADTKKKISDEIRKLGEFN